MLAAAPKDLIGNAAGRIAAFRATMRRFRLPMAVAAAAFFILGCWHSIRSLGISTANIDAWPLAVLIFASPVSLIHSGIGLQVLARSAKTSITLRRAITVSTYANVADALPLPGGAMVRTGALVATGRGVRQSALLVGLAAVIWISLACLACGLALIAHGPGAAIALSAGGLAVTAFATGWLTVLVGGRNAAFTLLHRLTGMALISARLHLAFLALGLSLPWADALPFVAATIAGSAASIAPAGLGIGELLAALVAGTVAVNPAAAFLAVGIDRLICLAASGLYSIIALTAPALCPRALDQGKG